VRMLCDCSSTVRRSSGRRRNRYGRRRTDQHGHSDRPNRDTPHRSLLLLNSHVCRAPCARAGPLELVASRRQYASIMRKSIALSGLTLQLRGAAPRAQRSGRLRPTASPCVIDRRLTPALDVRGRASGKQGHAVLPAPLPAAPTWPAASPGARSPDPRRVDGPHRASANRRAGDQMASVPLGRRPVAQERLNGANANVVMRQRNRGEVHRGMTKPPSTRRGRSTSSSRSSAGSTCAGAFCHVTGRKNRRIAVGPTDV
jgi:hypothetical protein